MTIIQQVLTIIVAIFAVQLCRHLPFWLFPAHKPIPKFIQYLGRALPSAIFGLLIIYCYKNITTIPHHHALAQLLAGALVILVHLYKRNMFLSIGISTISYMIFIQKLFV